MTTSRRQDLTHLRTQLKSLSRVRDVLLDLFDAISDAQDSLSDQGGSGVQIGLEAVSAAKEYLIEKLGELTTVEVETNAAVAKAVS